MDLTWATIEDLARTSDEAAVRRRFDRRNLIWLATLLSFFTFVSFMEVVTEARSNAVWQVLVGSANFAVCAFSLFALFSRRFRAWPRRHLSATALTYVAVQYALVLTYTSRGDNWVSWAMILPLLMLGFRMAVAELALMHALLAVGGLVMLFFGDIRNTPQMLIGMMVINVLALGTELFFSRRMRLEVVGDLGERRVHAREQLRMREELQYARELQLSMLPECAPALPWVDICSVSLPATEVGGDYYDYFVEEGRIALVCGDVAGHGMAAGLVLAGLRSGFTLLRESLHDPAAVLRRLHDLVTQTSRRRMLVTVSVVLIDRDAKRATIASAGHPPVILRRADGSVETIDLFAPPLGVRLPVHIPQRTLEIAQGDTFVLHSDGIYETHNANGEDYGLERLEEVVRAHGGGAAEELRDAIVREVTAFRGSPDAAGDITIVGCRMV
jgi:Stage II sporulation protein E (SpoIIE)